MPGAPTASPAAPPPSAARRDRSKHARRMAREARVEREGQIISLLNRGVSVAEIASRFGVSIRHMRNRVRKILAERTPEAPAEFLALQVSRLNEALLVSYSAMHNSMTGTNFEAVDRVVRIVRELDRYHGFAPVPRPRQEPETRREEPEARRLPPPAETPVATLPSGTWFEGALAGPETGVLRRPVDPAPKVAASALVWRPGLAVAGETGETKKGSQVIENRQSVNPAK